MSEVPPQTARFWTGTTVACATAMALTWYASPDAGLLDASELAAASIDLGISHPPGHPSYHLASLPLHALPLATVAFRQTLLSVLALSSMAALVVRIGSRANGLTLAIGAAIALRFVAAPGVQVQALRTEVYALVGLLLLGVSALAVRAVTRHRGDAPPATVHAAVPPGGIGLVGGLALAVHHYLALFAALPIAIALALRGRWSTPRPWRTAVFACAAASWAWAWLPARGAREPEVAWAWPVTGEAFGWLVRADAFQQTATRAARVQPFDGLVEVVLLHFEQLGAPIVLGAIVGIVVWLRARLAAALLVVAVVSLNALTQLLFDFDAMNADVHGYFLLSSAWIAVCAILGWSELLRRVCLRWGQRAGMGGVFAFVAVVAVGLPTTNPWGPLRSDRDAETILDLFDASLPPDAVLVTTQFESVFLWWHARASWDGRPDVRHVHLPWMGWGPPRDAADARARVGGAPTTAEGLQQVAAAGQTVLIESDGFLPSSLVHGSTPCGPLRWLTGPAAPPTCAGDNPANWFGSDTASRAQRTRVRVQAAWQTARLSCAASPPEREACQAARAWLLRTLPNDPDVRALHTADLP